MLLLLLPLRRRRRCSLFVANYSTASPALSLSLSRTHVPRASLRNNGFVWAATATQPFRPNRTTVRCPLCDDSRRYASCIIKCISTTDCRLKSTHKRSPSFCGCYSATLVTPQLLWPPYDAYFTDSHSGVLPHESFWSHVTPKTTFLPTISTFVPTATPCASSAV